MTKIYPKSKYGTQCIGPCLHKGTIYMNDAKNIKMELTTNACRIEPYYDKNKEDMVNMEECDNPTTREDTQSLDFSSIIFDCNVLLRIIYGIYSFNAGINYLKDNFGMPYYTIKRILNCLWKTDGNDINIVDPFVIEFYIKFIKKYNTCIFYKAFSDFIIIESDKIFMTSKKTFSQDDDNSRKIKINYIMDKILTNNNMFKILSSYITTNENNWKDIKDHNIKINNHIIQYVMKNIILIK